MKIAKLEVSHLIIAIETLFIVLLLLSISRENQLHDADQAALERSRHREAYFSAYRQCLIDGVFEASKSQVYGKLEEIVKKCEDVGNIGKRLNFVGLQNHDEIKYLKKPEITILPNEECNVVTLGIGRDVEAEKKLQQLLPPLCRFSGADPVDKGNREIYTAFGGRFYAVAVSGTSGKKNASVLGFEGKENYVDHEFEHVDLIKFLKKYAGVTWIVDYLLMDSESAEYEMLSYFLNDGELDRNGIVVCQWTCEFHQRGREKLADFLIKSLVAGKFLPFKTNKPSHLQTVMFNVKDDACLRRYLPEVL